MDKQIKVKKWKVPQTYATIPSVVRFSKRVSGNAKLLYGDIVLMSHMNGYCNASNDYFGFIYGVDDKTISEWVKQLKDSGFIKCPVMKRAYERHIYPQIGKMKEYEVSQENTTLESGKADLTGSGKPDNNITSNNTIINNIQVSEIFNSEEYIRNTIGSSNKLASIVALFALKKKKKFSDKKSANAFIYSPMNQKFAKELKEFDEKDIIKAMKMCDEYIINGRKVDWSLSAVIKAINK
jgi:hypothetical protein